jgi:hypothetical protein
LSRTARISVAWESAITRVSSPGGLVLDGELEQLLGQFLE